MAVEVRIETAPRHKNDQHVVITFTIINKTEQDIYVLKWNTPLEGLRSDCLEVTVNGHRVKYDSMLAKRRKPRKEDYVLIEAGKSISTKVNLDEAYDVSEQGEYVVTFDESKLVIVAEAGTKLESITEITETTHAEVIPQPTNFQIDQGVEPRQTIGEQMRSAMSKKKEVTELILEVAPQLLKPGFIGGTPGRRRSVSSAHKNAYQYVTKGIEVLGDNEDYTEWFGKHTANREKKVKDNLTTIKEAMESTGFVYDLTGDGDCVAGDYYAFTYFGVPVIWICSLFWDAPARGLGSKAGTIVHEHSHSSAEVDDIRNVYGEDDCRKLAAEHPGDAIDNADNYEFFVEQFD